MIQCSLSKKSTKQKNATNIIRWSVPTSQELLVSFCRIFSLTCLTCPQCMLLPCSLPYWPSQQSPEWLDIHWLLIVWLKNLQRLLTDYLAKLRCLNVFVRKLKERYLLFPDDNLLGSHLISLRVDVPGHHVGSQFGKPVCLKQFVFCLCIFLSLTWDTWVGRCQILHQWSRRSDPQYPDQVSKLSIHNPI